MQPDAVSYFGYIFRMVLDDNNIDLMHGFLPSRPDNFQLIVNDQESESSFSVPLSQLTEDWITFHIMLDLDNQTMICKALNITKEVPLDNYSAGKGLRLFFGAHTFGHYTTTDVCQMSIKDIKISIPGKKNYHWPLDQYEGSVVVEKNHRANGLVVNPSWLMTLHSQWEAKFGLDMEGYVKMAADTANSIIYLASSRSIKAINLTDYSINIQEYAAPYKMLSTNDLIYDHVKNRLLCYSLEQNYMHAYDPVKRTWS